MAIIYTNQSSGSLRRTKKKMKNLSSNQISKFEEELRVHTKFMKQKGLHSMLMTLDEYIKYRFGQSPKVKTTFVPLQSVPHVRETPDYPSLSNSKNMGNGGTIDHKHKWKELQYLNNTQLFQHITKVLTWWSVKKTLKQQGEKYDTN